MYSNFVNISNASTTEFMAIAAGVFSDFSGFIFLIVGVILGFFVIEYFLEMIPRRWNYGESYASEISAQSPAGKFMAGRRAAKRRRASREAVERELAEARTEPLETNDNDRWGEPPVM